MKRDDGVKTIRRIGMRRCLQGEAIARKRPDASTDATAWFWEAVGTRILSWHSSSL